MAALLLLAFFALDCLLADFFFAIHKPPTHLNYMAKAKGIIVHVLM
jgi:hypothetical protein